MEQKKLNDIVLVFSFPFIMEPGATEVKYSEPSSIVGDTFQK